MQLNVLFFFCLDSFRGTQWKLRMCYSPVYLNACDNIRGSILLHSGVLPLASHRSRIRPDVVQILKTYHVCFVFLWTQNMSKRLLFLQTESFLYCSLHGRNFCIIFNYIWPLLKVPGINAICKNIFPRASL